MKISHLFLLSAMLLITPLVTQAQVAVPGLAYAGAYRFFSLHYREGILQIAEAIRNRDAFPDSWGWMVMSGVADLVLAGLIISGWPGTASWALGLIVGVSIMTSGLAIMMAAFAGRSLVKTVAVATR